MRYAAHSYHDQEKAVIAALKTIYFMAKNLPNDHFFNLKQFLLAQGSTDIGAPSFQCGRGGRQFTYEHSKSVKSYSCRGFGQ